MNINKDIENFYDSLKILEMTIPKSKNLNCKELNYIEKLRFERYLNIISENQDLLGKKEIEWFKSQLLKENINYCEIIDTINKKKKKNSNN